MQGVSLRVTQRAHVFKIKRSQNSVVSFSTCASFDANPYSTMPIAALALALVSPALVLRRPPLIPASRLRMCADSGDLGFSRARLDALPSDPATTATQMSAALMEALDSGARTLAVNIEVPELLPSSRGYDVDAHALLALAAVQALCRDAAASASVLTHTLDCALRTQVATVSSAVT